MQPVGDALHRRRIAKARLELDVERRRQELRLEHVLEFAELLRARSSACSCVTRSTLCTSGYFATSLGGDRDLLDRRLLGDERADLDALLDLLERVADVERDEPEQSEREERERDRRDAQRAQQRSAAKREKASRTAGIERAAHSRIARARPSPPRPSRTRSRP